MDDRRSDDRGSGFERTSPKVIRVGVFFSRAELEMVHETQIFQFLETKDLQRKRNLLVSKREQEMCSFKKQRDKNRPQEISEFALVSQTV